MTLDIIITLLLVLLNGFFVAAEFAIVKVRVSQLELEIKKGNKTAKMAKNIVSHLDGYLAATQLGITLASLGLGWMGEPVVARLILKGIEFIGLTIRPELAHHIALPVAFAIITTLHIIFGELAPKSIAIQRSESTALYLAYPLQFFSILFKPFIWILNGLSNFFLKVFGLSSTNDAEIHSSEELKYLVKQGKDSGVIEETGYNIIKNAFDFSARTAKQIMIPRTQVLAININNYNNEMLDTLIDEGYSRIPCFENYPDNIIGVVYLKDLLLKIKKKEEISIREMVRPIMAVPGSKQIMQIMKDFQVKHQQIAIVVNEYGGTDGIITMEDIIEELVGEIQDEYDNELPVVEKFEDGLYSVQASATLDDINLLLPHSIEKEEDYETLAGKLIYKFERIPNLQDKIIFEDYEFTIIKKNKSSIMVVHIRDLRPLNENQEEQNEDL